MYAVIKEIIRLQGGPDAGSVRAPLLELAPGDEAVVKESADMIAAAIPPPSPNTVDGRAKLV